MNFTEPTYIHNLPIEERIELLLNNQPKWVNRDSNREKDYDTLQKFAHRIFGMSKGPNFTIDGKNYHHTTLIGPPSDEYQKDKGIVFFCFQNGIRLAFVDLKFIFSKSDKYTSMKYLKTFNPNQKDEILDHFVDLSDDGVKIEINGLHFSEYIQIEFEKSGGLLKSDIISIMNSSRRLNSYYEVRDFFIKIDDEIGLSIEHFNINHPEDLNMFLDGVGESEFRAFVIIIYSE